jgi:hypothetical protein
MKNSIKTLPIFVVLIAAHAALAQATQICSDEQATKQEATNDLAEKIDAGLSSRSTKTTNAVGETSRQEYNSVTEIDRKLLNLQAVKVDSVGKGRFKACMLKTDAAKPYLISLRNLSAKLVNLGKKINSESCNDMRETYADIENVEKVLVPLGQMDAALEKEYKPAYAKAKEECGKVGKGVYIESDNAEFAGKMASFFRDFGCDVVKSGLEASMRLSLKNVKECGERTSERGFYFCRTCVDADLQDSKTDKSLYSGLPFKSKAATRKDMKESCQKAFENAPKELWDKIKGNIKKENCK